MNKQRVSDEDLALFVCMANDVLEVLGESGLSRFGNMAFDLRDCRAELDEMRAVIGEMRQLRNSFRKWHKGETPGAVVGDEMDEALGKYAEGGKQ